VLNISEKRAHSAVSTWSTKLPIAYILNYFMFPFEHNAPDNPLSHAVQTDRQTDRQTVAINQHLVNSEHATVTSNSA